MATPLTALCSAPVAVRLGGYDLTGGYLQHFTDAVDQESHAFGVVIRDDDSSLGFALEMLESEPRREVDHRQHSAAEVDDTLDISR